MIKKTISMALLIVAMTCTIAIGAAHLAVNMKAVSEEVLNVNELFPSVIHAKFEIAVDNELVYSKVVGSFKGVKLIMQVGSERTIITDLVVEDTIINLVLYGFEVGTPYELCVQPYYDFGVYGVKNVAEMSEYNFSSYTVTSSEIGPPTSIKIIF